jgi:uncharacterized protein YjbI with pentapeptide repeats
MALSAKVGAFNTGTGAVGTDVVVTGVGFLPKVIFFWTAGRTGTTDSQGESDSKKVVGAASAPTSQGCSSEQSAHGLPTTSADRHTNKANCVVVLTTAAAIEGSLSLASMDPDGFTLDTTDQFDQSYRIHYLALGGDALTAVTIAEIGITAGAGTLDITSVGFQPDCLVMFGGGIASAAPAFGTGGGQFPMGWTDGIGHGFYCGMAQDAATTSNTFSYLRTDELMGLPGNTGTFMQRVRLNAWLSNGFQLSKVESDMIRYYIYVALQGGNYQVGSFLTKTDTTTTEVVAPGFVPRAGLLVSHCKAESGVDVSQSHDEWSLGAFTSPTERGAQGIGDRDNRPDSEIGTILEHDAVYVNQDVTVTPVVTEGLMDVSAMDATSITFIMDDADPAPALVSYLIFGEVATVGANFAGTVTSLATVAAPLTTIIQFMAPLDGIATVVASLTPGIQLTAALNATGTVVGALTVTAAAPPFRWDAVDLQWDASTVTWDGTYAVTLTGTVQATGLLAGMLSTVAATLTGTVVTRATVTGPLQVGTQLSAGTLATAILAGSLTSQVQLAGPVGATATLTGILQVGTQLTTGSLAIATLAGSLTSQVRLAGPMEATAILTGTLQVGTQLTTAALATATLTGTLQVGTRLTAGSLATATLDATLFVLPAGLAGQAVGQATLAGAVLTGLQLTGIATGHATATGSVLTSLQLASTVMGQATVTGALTLGLPGALLSGAVTAIGTVTGSLSLGSLLNGALTATATGTAALTMGAPPALLSGAAMASATGTGTLIIGSRLSGALTGLATLTGALSPGVLVEGTLQGIAIAQGTLTIQGLGELGSRWPTYTEREPTLRTTVPSVHRHNTRETVRRHTEGALHRSTTRHVARRTVEITP